MHGRRERAPARERDDREGPTDRKPGPRESLVLIEGQDHRDDRAGRDRRRDRAEAGRPRARVIQIGEALERQEHRGELFYG